jgi:hypothetical protein
MVENQAKYIKNNGQLLTIQKCQKAVVFVFKISRSFDETLLDKILQAHTTR